MNAVPFDIKIHGAWFKQRAKAVYCEDTNGIVIEDKGIPVAGCIFDSWCPNSAVGHYVIDNPLAMRILPKEVFNYFFITCGRGVLLGTTTSANPKVIKLNLHLGFSEMGRIKDGYAPGIDFVIFQMRREDCRFIAQEQRFREVA